MKISVLIAADGASWEAPLVAAFEAHEYPVRASRRCVDVVDLLAAAGAGQGRAALVSAELRHLDADVVDRLRVAEVACIAVIARDDPASEQRMRAMGIDHLVPDGAASEVIAGVIADAVARPTPSGPDEIDRRLAFSDPMISATALPHVGPQDDASVMTTTPRNGSVIAVWGPTGAPGRSTVALGLADEISRLGAAALLIDADVYGGVIGAALGLLDESPGLAAACRLAASTRLEAAALAELCWQVTPGLRVLTGIALPQRWTEIRTAALGAVVGAARALADWVVLDVGFCLETDEELSFDSLAPRRNGATLATLQAADLVLAVGSCDPLGLARLVRGLTEYRDAEIETPVHVILNRVRRGIAPGDTATEAIEALERFCGRRPSTLLPLDVESLDAALAAGCTLGELRQTSALRRALVDLAREVTGITGRAERRRLQTAVGAST